jgi:histidine phosphotransfer protein HptB
MIRWERYEELRQEVGDEDLAEIVDLFLAELEEAMTAMMSVPVAGLTADAFHSLKGSCLNIGFDGLASLCAVAESAVISGKADAIDRDLIAETYTASRAGFLGRLRNAA